MPLNHLPGDCLLRVVTSFPLLSYGAADALVAALEKLFVQFQAEGRCADYGLEVAGDGAFVLMAWVGPVLSGCSHDKIGKVLALHEGRSSVRLLAPPPIVAEVDGKPAHFTHATFKAAAVEGSIAEETPMWDTLADTLGAWRHSGKRPLHDHWAFPLFQRAMAAKA